MGYPARYVSGYLMMNDRVHQDASHAWAEAHVEGVGWVGFDVSNGISPDARYVRVATGLDYREAAPISGLRFGQGGEALVHRHPGTAAVASGRGRGRGTAKMTYCVGLKLNRGLVMMSDTRTNAGVDNISVFRKMFLWETEGERSITLMTAGNLATTQAVVSLLNERANRRTNAARPRSSRRRRCSRPRGWWARRCAR
jgi:hypothetical protein